MVCVMLMSVTIGAYHSDMSALTAFSFPLTAGLVFALYAGLVLVPLLWYEFRFGRERQEEKQILIHQKQTPSKGLFFCLCFGQFAENTAHIRRFQRGSLQCSASLCNDYFNLYLPFMGYS